MCLKLLWDASAFLIFHSEKLNKIRSDLFSGRRFIFSQISPEINWDGINKLEHFSWLFLFQTFRSMFPRCSDASRRRSKLLISREKFCEKENWQTGGNSLRCCLFSWQLWMGKFLRHEGVDCLEVSDFTSKHKSFFASLLYIFFQLSSLPLNKPLCAARKRTEAGTSDWRFIIQNNWLLSLFSHSKQPAGESNNKSRPRLAGPEIS